MKIWKCTYEEIIGGDVFTDTVEFDDGNILLDCICESYDEMINYMINTCLSWCRSHHVKFVAFEIIAE